MRYLLSSTKVWTSLLGISILLLLVGYQLGGRLGLFLGFLLTVGFHFLVSLYGRSTLLDHFQAKKLSGQDPWGLQAQIRRHSMLLQIDKPDFYLLESSHPMAFCVVQSGGQSAICLSTGLLSRLDPLEIEAVVAHQICHIFRLSSYGYGLAHVISFAILGLGKALSVLTGDFLLRKQEGGRFFNILERPFGLLASTFLRWSLSEKIYFQNDEMAAALLKDRRALARALWKLESLAQTHPFQPPPCSSHFFIVNPSGFKTLKFDLRAHPEIDNRIKKLMGYFPI